MDEADITFTAVIAVGDVPDKDGNVYPSEELESMADGKRLFWDAERKALMWQGPALHLAYPREEFSVSGFTKDTLQ